jgi:hypothetical protein
LVLDPVRKSYELLTHEKFNTGSWSDGAVALDGKLYAVPGDGTEVCIIDCHTHTFEFLGSSLLAGTDFKYLGCVLHPNGSIYAIPHSDVRTQILEFKAPKGGNSWALSHYVNKY